MKDFYINMPGFGWDADDWQLFYAYEITQAVEGAVAEFDDDGDLANSPRAIMVLAKEGVGGEVKKFMVTGTVRYIYDARDHSGT